MNIINKIMISSKIQAYSINAYKTNEKLTAFMLTKIKHNFHKFNVIQKALFSAIYTKYDNMSE